MISMLGHIKKNPPFSTFAVFLLFLLIPNILRQIIYFTTFSFTRSVDFIASFETKLIYASDMFFIGIIEEIFIGIVFTIFWFKFSRLRFFAYGWITDALFDFISVVTWFFIGLTPLQALGFNNVMEFALREVILFYIITGPLLYKFNASIRKLSIYYALFGLLVLLTVTFLSL